jgi:hypothetical protein
MSPSVPGFSDAGMTIASMRCFVGWQHPRCGLAVCRRWAAQVWKQQVLVNNYPGAGGSLAVRLAAAAAPDGYTLYQPVLSSFEAGGTGASRAV